MEMIDVNIKVPAIEKLVDYTASGIGSVAGSILAPWKARREALAKQIAAEGEAETQRILARGQSDSLQIIAKAQSEARSNLVSSDSTIQGELDIDHTVHQRILFQERKRQRNIGMVVEQAARELGDRSVPNDEPDHDWTARFFNEVQDVSSEEMQSLWAKVLVGEVERPRSTSIKTLSILKNLDQATAVIFRKLCSACISFRPFENQIEEARVPFLGSYDSGNALEKYGFNYDTFNVLNEHGLILPEYDSWRDYSRSIGYLVSKIQQVVQIPFHYQEKYWVLSSTSKRPYNQEFKISGVALTRSGMELSRVVKVESMKEYTQALKGFFKKQGLQMVEVDTWEPRSFAYHS